jgi:hypothetical protein
MEGSNVDKAKSPNEALLELLEKKPQIYQDAVKWTLLCWNGISLASLFENEDLGSKVDRETLVKELHNDDSFSIVDDPKGGSDVLLKLTEKGRDEIIDLFYDGKEKRELKRLIKKADLQLKKE